MTALKIILIVFGAIVLWLALIRIIRKFYYHPAPAFIGRFLDSDLRRWLQPPDKMIGRSGIKPGMMVMELGCGSGAFTPFIAREVGEREGFVLEGNLGNLWNYTVRFKQPLLR